MATSCHGGWFTSRLSRITAPWHMRFTTLRIWYRTVEGRSLHRAAIRARYLVSKIPIRKETSQELHCSSGLVVLPPYKVLQNLGATTRAEPQWERCASADFSVPHASRRFSKLQPAVCSTVRRHLQHWPVATGNLIKIGRLILLPATRSGTFSRRRFMVPTGISSARNLLGNIRFSP